MFAKDFKKLDLDKEKIISFAKNAINSEINYIKEMANYINDDFYRAINMIMECKGKVVLMGLGKSGHVAKKMIHIMAT